MPHYQNVPFEVPSSWVWCKLEDYVKSVTDGDHQAPPKSDIGIPFLVISDVAKGKLNFLNTRFVPQEYYEKISFDRKPEKGDLLFTVTGSYGIVVPVNIDCKFCFQRHIGLIKTLNTSEYLLHLLKSSYIKGQCDEFATGTAQKTVGLETLRSFLLPIPPFAEQQRIVIEIEKWFSLIELIEGGKDDLQTTIKQAKSKILDLAIHGKLVPQDPNDEPAIELLKRINPDFTPCDNGHSRKLPQGWYSVTANDVCSIIGGVSYNKADIQDTGIRVLRGGNIQNGKVIDCFDDVFISLSYQNNDNQVQRGDIIVVASTGSQTLIGKTGFADRDIPKTQIGAFLRIVRPKQKTLSPYIRLIFQTDAYKDYIRNVAKGSNINNVKNAHLQNFQICLPPLEEQQRIVQKIEELFSSLDDILTALEV